MPTEILIADGSPTVRATLADVFRREGYETVLAERAGDVLSIAEKRRPVLFLLNLDLPDIESLSFFDELRSHAPTATIIVLSPDSRFGPHLDAMHHGVDDVLDHSIDPEHLIDVVRRAEQQARERIVVTGRGDDGDELVGVPECYRLLECGASSIAVLGADGAVRYANRTLLQLLGANREDAVNRSLVDLFRECSTAIDAEFVAFLESAAESDTFRHLGALHVQIGKTDRYFDVSLTPVDGAGSGDRVLVTLYEVSKWITDHHLLNGVVNDLREAVVVTDNDMRVRFWSVGAEALFGYSQSEIIGKTLSILCPDDDTMPCFSDAVASVDAVGDEEESIVHRARRLRRDGVTIDVELTRSLLTDHRGKPVGVCEIVRDVTVGLERERQIEALRLFYERVIDTISDGIRVIETENRRIVLANYAHLEWAGREAGDVIGLTCSEVPWGANSRGEPVDVEDLVNRALESGEPERAVFDAGPSAETGSHWSDIVAYPMRGTRGSVEYVVLVGRDISDRMKMEAMLAAERDRREQVLRSTPIGILTTDAKGTIEFVNPHVAKIFGVPDPEEIRWRNLFDIPQVRQLNIGDEIRRILKTGESISRDRQTCTTRHGREIVINIRARPLSDQNRQIIGVVGVIEDVTETVSLQRRLRASTADLAMLAEIGELFQESRDIDTILQAILVGVTAGEGLGFNRAFLLTTDWDAGVLCGKYAIGPADRDEAGRIWEALSRRRISLYEILVGYQREIASGHMRINDIAVNLRLPLADAENIAARAAIEQKAYLVQNGREHPLVPRELAERLGTDEFGVVPLLFNNRVEGVIIADNAITGKSITNDDLRSLELFAHQATLAVERSRLYTELENSLRDVRTAHRQLQENHEMMVRTERLAAMGQMAAQVAHEIRNPMVSIGGFARNVLKQLDENDRARQHLAIIVEETTRLEKILNDVLQFSRPRIQHRAHFDIVNLIRRTVSVMESEIAERDIDIVLSLPESPVVIIADADQIQQVLRNLMTNALDSMTRESSHMDLTKDEPAGTLRASLTVENGRVVIAVEDTGVGIVEGETKQLFEPFYTTKNNGTGLGLAICSQIVNDHGGEISVANNQWGGASFFVTLPVDEEDSTNGANTGR